jgi:hypothetical protein
MAPEMLARYAEAADRRIGSVAEKGSMTCPVSVP